MSDKKSEKKTEKKKQSIAACAARKLELRDVSVADMRTHLLRKGYEADEVEETIEQLLSFEYLDDVRFAAGYFRSAFAKNKSKRRAEAELAAKGVSKNDIEDGWLKYTEEYGEPDENEQALREAEKVLRLAEYPEGEPLTDKLKGRIARRLAAKGYSPGTAYRTLEEIELAKRR